jgi:hypothetical protein
MNFFLKNNKLAVCFLAICWLVVNIYLFFTARDLNNGESATYLNLAKIYLETGELPFASNYLYSTQIFLDVIFLKLNLNLNGILFVQILFNGLSTICMYRLLLYFSKKAAVAFFGILLFLANYQYHNYNVMLYTDSLFFSFTIIFRYFLFAFEKINLKNILVLLLLLFTLSVTRPTGIFLVMSTALYVYSKFFTHVSKLKVFVYLFVSIIVFAFLLNNAIGSGGSLDFLLPYQYAITTCGVHTLTVPNKIIVPGNANSIQGLCYIMWHYPNLFFGFGLTKMKLFWGIHRSYYSLIHNIYICTIFYSLYLLCIAAIKKMYQKFKPEFFYHFSYIILFTATVFISCDEWGNRFIMALYPSFLLIAASFFNTHITIKPATTKNTNLTF